MAANDTQLGDILAKYLARRDQSPTWLSRQLRVAPSTVLRWLDGETRPRDAATLTGIVHALHIDDKADKESLWKAAGYLHVEQPAGTAEAAEAATAATVAAPELPDANSEAAPAQQVRLPDEPGSGDEKLLALLRAATGRVTPPGLLRFILALGTAWLACNLVIPLLLWPANGAAHRTASTTFGLATLLIPLLVAISVKPHAQVRAAVAAQPGRAAGLLLLQMAGALVCFYIATALALAAGMAVVAVRAAPLPTALAALLVLCALLFSYWGSRIIPLSRVRLDAALNLLPVDRWVLFAFLLAGPFSAVFLHFNRHMLLDQGFLVILLAVLVGWLLWETRPYAWHPLLLNLALVLFWGVALPCIVLFVPLLVGGGLAAGAVDVAVIAMFAGHVIGQATLLAVLYVRGQARLPWPGPLGIILLELVALTVFAYRPAWGLYCLAGLAVILLAVWWLGRGRLHATLWMHPSFWLMQALFVASLAAWIAGLGWPGVVLFLGVASALIAWAAWPAVLRLRAAA